MTKARRQHQQPSSSLRLVKPSVDPQHADKVFGDKVRSLEERQARRREDRETMQSRVGMRRFATGLAIGAIAVVGAIEGLRLYVSGQSQQAQANHAALQANVVKPTEDAMRAAGIVEPPTDDQQK